MNKRKLLLLAMCITITLSPVFAQETNYIKMNKDARWARTSYSRLARVINNPVKYNPEEFIAALHEYSKRHGQFQKPRNTLQALVNAYIAFNPEYRRQSTEEIFIKTGRSRGVPSLQGLASENEDFHTEDYISPLLELFEENFHSLELAGEGLYDDGTAYTVYQIDDSIKITVSTDKDETEYIIGNVKSAEVMQKIINLLTKTYSKPIPYLNTGDFMATFHDTQNLYINNTMPDYLGTFTILGSQMFIEEVTVKDKIIVQRQWCTPDFYDICAAELGRGWGFIASWDNNK
jgi:hypothetical protein